MAGGIIIITMMIMMCITLTVTKLPYLTTKTPFRKQQLLTVQNKRWNLPAETVCLSRDPHMDILSHYNNQTQTEPCISYP